MAIAFVAVIAIGIYYFVWLDDKPAPNPLGPLQVGGSLPIADFKRVGRDL